MKKTFDQHVAEGLARSVDRELTAKESVKLAIRLLSEESKGMPPVRMYEPLAKALFEGSWMVARDRQVDP